MTLSMDSNVLGVRIVDILGLLREKNQEVGVIGEKMSLKKIIEKQVKEFDKEIELCTPNSPRSNPDYERGRIAGLSIGKIIAEKALHQAVREGLREVELKKIEYKKIKYRNGRAYKPSYAEMEQDSGWNAAVYEQHQAHRKFLNTKIKEKEEG